MLSTASAGAVVVSPSERLEVLFEELAELSGQRNAIDGRIVEIVAEIDGDQLCGITGARSVPARCQRMRRGQLPGAGDASGQRSYGPHRPPGAVPMRMLIANFAMLLALSAAVFAPPAHAATTPSPLGPSYCYTTGEWIPFPDTGGYCPDSEAPFNGPDPSYGQGNHRWPDGSDD